MLSVGGLFDGIGLLAYGLHRAGLDHRWLCEIDPFRQQVLARRWPGVRIYDDVRAVGADAERVDVIAGGFPCKGASTAGKRQGFDHPETRLWREMARAVGELRPRFVVVENVANILGLHGGGVWGTVLGDLATLGYDVQWDCIPAAAFGAPHLRDRVIAVAADADGSGQQWLADMGGESLRWPDVGGGAGAATADAARERRQARPSEARSLGRAASGGLATAADASGGGQPEHAEPNSERRSGFDGAPGHDLERRGVAVEWGEYKPVIRRWERAIGPAPEPLVRRVDDRRAMRVERSRLSALGDGVQVQLGELVGRYLMERAASGNDRLPIHPNP